MHRFTAPLWRYQGDSAWYFITVPVDLSDDIRELTEGTRRGFGSVRVRATVGATAWTTSVFPDTKRGAFLLPVKKAVRAAEGLDDGDAVDVVLELLDA
ncbi:MAG: DUF1905 domain-containing protein [Actinomycetes bacterium]